MSLLSESDPSFLVSHLYTLHSASGSSADLVAVQKKNSVRITAEHRRYISKWSVRCVPKTDSSDVTPVEQNKQQCKGSNEDTMASKLGTKDEESEYQGLVTSTKVQMLFSSSLNPIL